MPLPVFIFVESNTTGTGPLFFDRARALGFRPLLFCRDVSRYRFLSQANILGGNDAVSCVDTTDLAALLERCQDVARAQDVAGIFSSSEYFIASAAWLAQEFHLPGGDPDAIRLCRNKAWQRSRLTCCGDVNPRYATASTVEAAVRGARSIGLPVVTKPTHGTGSIGVRLCTSIAEIQEHAATLLEDVTLAHSEILIEEMIEGPEYSVEIFNGNVLGITKKHLGRLPHFVEIGHDFPAPLPPSDAAALSTAAAAAAGALGLRWGPVHVELRLTADGAKIMEVNPNTVQLRISVGAG